MFISLLIFVISFLIVCSGNRSLQKELNESRRNEYTARDRLHEANEKIKRNAINHCAEIAELQDLVLRPLIAKLIAEDEANERSKKNAINHCAELPGSPMQATPVEEGEDFIEQCRRNT